MKKILFFLLFIPLACSKQKNNVTADKSALQVPFCDVRQIPGKSAMASKVAEGEMVIYLDFDGETIDNTAWNYNGPIICAPSGLTTAQQSAILAQTAEDYSAFNVIVTADSSLYWAGNPTRRQRCIFTTTYQWFGLAGGVSYIGSFSWGDDTPCFVFTSLLNYVTKTIQDAGSHEFGHTIGLYHQSTYNENCVKTSEYNYGQGSGETGWAPIMGVPYYQNLNTFFDGPNSFGCHNYQDDIGIISSVIPLRQDDFSNTFEGAYPLQTDVSTDGIIESKDDADMFQINYSSDIPKSYTVELISHNNIDGKIEVYNAAGQLLLIIDPPGRIHIKTIELPLDSRYIKVSSSATSPNIKQEMQLGRYSIKVKPVVKFGTL